MTYWKHWKLRCKVWSGSIQLNCWSHIVDKHQRHLLRKAGKIQAILFNIFKLFRFRSMFMRILLECRYRWSSIACTAKILDIHRKKCSSACVEQCLLSRQLSPQEFIENISVSVGNHSLSSWWTHKKHMCEDSAVAQWSNKLNSRLYRVVVSFSGTAALTR